MYLIVNIMIIVQMICHLMIENASYLLTTKCTLGTNIPADFGFEKRIFVPVHSLSGGNSYRIQNMRKWSDILDTFSFWNETRLPKNIVWKYERDNAPSHLDSTFSVCDANINSKY